MTVNGETVSYDDYNGVHQPHRHVRNILPPPLRLAGWVKEQVGGLNPDERVEVSIPVRAGEVLGVARVRPGQCCLDWVLWTTGSSSAVDGVRGGKGGMAIGLAVALKYLAHRLRGGYCRR
nr:hypothetical protein [Candidatus Freyrarchaeum guaymaensis]